MIEVPCAFYVISRTMSLVLTAIVRKRETCSSIATALDLVELFSLQLVHWAG